MSITMRRTLLATGLLLALTSPAAANDDLVIADFEGEDFGDWTLTGEAFGAGPVLAHKLQIKGFRGKRLANSFGTGDPQTGELTSPPFVIEHRWITFLIGGGRHAGQTGIELLIDGKPVQSATGHDSGQLRWESWFVDSFLGSKAQIRLFDRAGGPWGHINVDEILQTDTPRFGSGVPRLEEYRFSTEYYREPYRPQYHFTPELNWMNDPNGLVYYDGEYHLFYQHNPLGNEWGHMSWGHAVSTDLLHWKHLPIALRDEYGVMVFSGSAVVDHRNTSRFGQGDQPPLVAIYTGHSDDRQTQDIAYSNDRGRSWTRFARNPVIDLAEKDFRDPKVFWHEPTRRWVMVVSLAVQKRLQFYGSNDLQVWTLLSEFGPAGAPNKLNWECPDLFELPIENEPGSTRWVLEADMGNGAVAGGSGGEFFTGIFDGVKFVADSMDSQWVDFGRDFYAPVSWSDIPASDGRRIWIGWMNNWETALNPTSPWRSAMSIPRQLTLRRIQGVLRLCQRPVNELRLLREQPVTVADKRMRNDVLPVEHSGQQVEIIVEFEPLTADEVGVRVLKGTREQTVVGYDVRQKSLFVDRTRSGIVDFHPTFAGRHAGPLDPDENGRIRLHILVDACSVEVFGNWGETVITDLVFPAGSSNQIELYARGGECQVISCQAYPLKSVWPRR